MRVLGLSLAMVGFAVTGCAGVGEAVAGVCLAVAVQSVCQSCVDIGVGAVCEGDPSHDVTQQPDESPTAEIPPPDPIHGSSHCRVKQLAGGIWRLNCVDGTVAESLQFDERANGPITSDERTGADTTLPGDLVVSSLVDVIALNGVRAVLGELRVTGPALTRLEVPSLRSVGGDVVVVDAAHLSTLRMGALIHVGGRLQIDRNPVLQTDPVPAVTNAASVDVAFNDSLTPMIVDRLMSIRPRAP